MPILVNPLSFHPLKDDQFFNVCLCSFPCLDLFLHMDNLGHWILPTASSCLVNSDVVPHGAGYLNSRNRFTILLVART